MLWSRLLILWYGKYKCIFYGSCFNRFINICRYHHIYISDIHYIKEHIVFYVGAMDLEKCRDIAKTCSGQIVIIQKNGIKNWCLNHIKHRIFFVNGICFIFLIGWLSAHIWDIDISGNYLYSENDIITWLKKQDISCGKMKKDIDLYMLEKKLRRDYPSISWISAQIIGTKLSIYIEETDIEKSQKDLYRPSITADQAGKVVSIVTHKGTPIVHKGDIVQEGDTLINGQIDIIGDDGQIKERIHTGAEGEVIMEYDIHLKYGIKHDYQEKVYTGDSKQKYNFIIGEKWNIPIGKESTEKKQSDYIKSVKQYKLTKHLYLPFTLIKQEWKFFDWKQKKYSEDELKQLLFEWLMKKEKDYIENQGKIINKRIKFKSFKDQLSIECDLKIHIPAGRLP